MSSRSVIVTNIPALWRKVFVFLLIQSWSVCQGNENKTIRIGLVMPFHHPRLGWENNAAAATIAIQSAQREGILQDYDITIHYKDDKCNAEGGVSSALELRNEYNVDVFIGPPCSGSTTSCGLLAAYWNLPLFSMASSDPELADKSVYKTLVRLGPPFNRLGYALVEVFRKFSWSQLVLVSRIRTDNRQVFCDFSSRAVLQIFRANNLTVSDHIQIEDGILDWQIDQLLTRVRQRGRVILLCSENASDKRRILIRAFELGMTNSDFVYITPDHLPPSTVATPWLLGQSDDHKAKKAYERVFQITVAESAGPEFEQFRDNVTEKMAEAPWFYNRTKEIGLRGSEYSPFLHDVVYLYLLVVNDSVSNGLDYRDGQRLFKAATGKTFRGVTGNVKVDRNGDREPDYWIWDLSPGGSRFEVVLEAQLTAVSEQKIVVLNPIDWGTVDGRPPPDHPPCGFFNELCKKDASDETTVIGIVTSCVLVLLVVAIIGYWYYRKVLRDKEVDQMLWMVPYDDIRFTKGRCVGSISQMSLHSLVSDINSGTLSDTRDGQLFSAIGVFKGRLVAIKKLSVVKVTITRLDKVHFKRMRDLSHENVNAFMGICLDERFPCVLSAYCSKGSLQDIIEHEDIKLDWMFRNSLITDMTNGLQYLHTNDLRYHGNLKSSNCLVDNRWVLKLGDFGLGSLRVSDSHMSENETYKGLFWTAPEILSTGRSTKSTMEIQKADMYSYGIILWEVLYRLEPYDTHYLTPKEIVNRVKIRETPPYRPCINHSDQTLQSDPDIPKLAFTIADYCLEQNPDKRPSVDNVRRQWLSANKGKRVNIVDNMVNMLERYANNLEDIVEQRTSELIEERKKSDQLLYRMLPKVVAERLKTGQTVEPEVFESVTIYFSDIVGFTSLAGESTPMEVVDLLNTLYTKFDFIIFQHDVYKVETIGDAYMVVSGLPVRNMNRHVAEIANMALDLLASIVTFRIPGKPDKQLLLRIGLHTGSCAAGVVGLAMPRYCLFGDTVNMASRMESTGEALKIHVSENTYQTLNKYGGYRLEKRGNMQVKGKGLCTTYWLLSKEKNSNHGSGQNKSSFYDFSQESTNDSIHNKISTNDNITKDPVLFNDKRQDNNALHKIVHNQSSSKYEAQQSTNENYRDKLGTNDTVLHKTNTMASLPTSSPGNYADGSRSRHRSSQTRSTEDLNSRNRVCFSPNTGQTRGWVTKSPDPVSKRNGISRYAGVTQSPILLPHSPDNENSLKDRSKSPEHGNMLNRLPRSLDKTGSRHELTTVQTYPAYGDKALNEGHSSFT